MIDSRDEFQKVSETAEHIATSIADLLASLIKRQGYTEDFDAYAIAQHVTNGGSTIQTTVSLERADMMIELLKKNHIAHVCVNNVDPVTGEQNYIFIMKDTKGTRNAFAEVQKEFQILLDNDKKEIQPYTFISLYRDTNIGVADNLSKEEILAFRNVTKHYDIKYSIGAGTEEGTYCIYCNDAQVLKNALMDVSYNLSGTKGLEYKDELCAYSKNYAEFIDKVSSVVDGQMLYMVDANDPRHFVSISDKEYISHSVNLQTEKLPGGKTREVIADTMHKSYDIGNKDGLVAMAKMMKRPVLLKAEDFELVSSISSNGEAYLVEDYMLKFDELKNRLKGKSADFTKQPAHKNAYEQCKIEGYVNLPKEMISSLSMMGLKDVHIIGSDIAFPVEQKQTIEVVMETILYKDLNPLQRKEAELFYKGAGDLVLATVPEETQYIVNIDHPDYVIKNSRRGLSVFKDGTQHSFIERTSPEFSEAAIALLSAIEHPAVLSSVEMYGEDKAEAVRSKTPGNVPNQAVEYLKTIEAKEKTELHSENPECIKALSKQQELAILHSKRYVVEEKTLDSKSEKEIMDKKTEKYIVHEKTKELGNEPNL